MIPGGYENTHYKKSKLDKDQFFPNGGDYYDDDDDENFDEEEGFVFDFVSNNTKSLQSKHEADKQPSMTTSNGPNLPLKHDCAWEEEPTIKSDEADKKKSKLVYELNNNYYFDESQYILDDLKNAILNRNLTNVKNLIQKHNLDVNCVLKSNWTPMMYAVTCGALDIVEYLIENGADIDFSDGSYNVLMCACGSVDPTANEYNLVKIVERLIEMGADVNSCDKYYQTPLMYACRANNASLIDVLIQHNAQIDAQDDNDWTSLAHASNKGNLKCVKKLLTYDADPIIHTNEYLFPFDLAKKNGHFEIYELMKNYLRVKKIQDSKDSLSKLLDDENEFEDEDDGLSNNYSTKTDEIEVFLNSLKLKNLVNLFRINQINMKSLLNFKTDDLKKIGVYDDQTCELILTEIKKFHHKNWQASSLTPVRTDKQPNCTEAIGMITNLSRHMDFMSANVKYLKREGVEDNDELFADGHLSARLSRECKQALNSCKELLNCVNVLCDKVQRKLKNESDTLPVDLIESSSTSRFQNVAVKIAAASALAVTGYFLFKCRAR